MRAMNRRFAALAFLLAPLACDRPQERQSAGRGLVVVNPAGDRPTFFDLGRLAFGRRAEHVFRIRNEDPVPVTVQDLLASCGCAAPRISYRSADGTLVDGDPLSRQEVIRIPPGSVAELAIAIDTTRVESMNLDKLAQVRLRCDSKNTPYLTFEVHLLVERTLRAVPAEIELGQTPQSVGKSGRTDLTVDLRGSRARVLGVESIEGPFTATVDETEVGGVPVWIVLASANPGLPEGPVSGKVTLSVSSDDGSGRGPSFDVRVRAQISPDVVLRPPILSFGTVERGKSAVVSGEIVALVPGERVRVTGTRVAGLAGDAAGFAVEATPVEPGDDGRAERWNLVLTTPASLAEPAFSGTLTIALDHPRVLEIRVPFSGATR